MPAAAAAAAVVFLGASYVEPGSPLVSAYGEAAGVEVIGSGVRGASLQRWVAAAIAEPVPSGTKAMIGEFGGNTSISRMTSQEIERADRSLRAAGYVPTWIVPPRWPEDSADRVRASRQAAHDAVTSAFVSRVDARWEPTDLDLAGDGIHLRRDSYAAFGRAIAAAEVNTFTEAASRRLGYAVAVLAGAGLLWWAGSRIGA